MQLSPLDRSADRPQLPGCGTWAFAAGPALFPAYWQRGSIVITRKANFGTEGGELGDECQFAGSYNRAGAILRIEFGIDVLDMLLHRADTDEKSVGDFAVG